MEPIMPFIARFSQPRRRSPACAGFYSARHDLRLLRQVTGAVPLIESSENITEIKTTTKEERERED